MFCGSSHCLNFDKFRVSTFASEYLLPIFPSACNLKPANLKLYFKRFAAVCTIGIRLRWTVLGTSIQTIPDATRWKSVSSLLLSGNVMVVSCLNAASQFNRIAVLIFVWVLWIQIPVSISCKFAVLSCISYQTLCLSSCWVWASLSFETAHACFSAMPWNEA